MRIYANEQKAEEMMRKSYPVMKAMQERGDLIRRGAAFHYCVFC